MDDARLMQYLSAEQNEKAVLHSAGQRAECCVVPTLQKSKNCCIVRVMMQHCITS